MNISERAQQLVSRPPEEKPTCKLSCIMLLIVLEDKIKIWRCETCGRQIRQDILRDSSIQGSLF